MDIIKLYKDRAKRIVEEKIKAVFSIDYNAMIIDAKEGYGDLSFPCFELANILKKDVKQVSSEIVNIKDDLFEKVIAVGPYINFYINSTHINKITIETILKDKMNYGTFAEKNETIILEHTSANPTGPLHIGRARNTIIGDTLGRVLKKYGYTVVIHYFVNDIGKQAATLIWGIKEFMIREEPGKQDRVLVKYYQKASESDKKELNVSQLVEKFEAGDPELIQYSRKYISRILDGIQESVKKLNVSYDLFFYESDLILEGYVKEIKERLGPYIKDDSGAKYIDIPGLNDKEKVYLFRADGTSLYLTRDIAYHLIKGRGSKLLVDVLGEDHKVHAETIMKILKKIEPDLNIVPIFYSFVSLPEGRMSTRKGKVIYLDDLIDEAVQKAKEEIEKRREVPAELLDKIAFKIGTSAVRYNIIKVQSEKSIVFDWSEALNFEGDSAPFILYTYVRAKSILNKEGDLKNFEPALLKDPQELKLIKLLAKYSEIIEISAKEYKPYKIAIYCFDLAMQFNQFYRDCPVLKAGTTELKNARLALVSAFKIVIENCAALLGLNMPEEM
jgi:arginyl-tRNA synthetase